MRAVVAGGLCWVLACATAAGAAQGVSSEDISIRWNGRIQSQFNTTSVDADDVDGDEVVSSTFELRRVRLAALLAIREWITGTIEIEYAMAQLHMRNVWL